MTTDENRRRPGESPQDFKARVEAAYTGELQAKLDGMTGAELDGWTNAAVAEGGKLRSEQRRKAMKARKARRQAEGEK